MDLYFAPLACSMATRITLHEAGLPANFIEVDTKTKTTMDGADYLAVNPLGLVPALRNDDGQVITENAAVLQFIANNAPGDLNPSDPHVATQIRQWLSFISTELHSGLFATLFDKGAPPEAKAYVIARGTKRLQRLNDHLIDRTFLLDRFTVADAYLLTVLNWAQATPVDLTAWPAITAYLARGLERPSVKAAIAVELPLFLEERRRHAASA